MTLRSNLGARSAIEWVIDRYQVKTESASGIVNDPNDWVAGDGLCRPLILVLAREPYRQAQQFVGRLGVAGNASMMHWLHLLGQAPPGVPPRVPETGASATGRPLLRCPVTSRISC